MSDLGEAEPSLRLSLDARPESIALLRRQLGGWLEETGATRGELFEIQLATTEAFANAVLHPEEPTSDLVEIADVYEGAKFTDGKRVVWKAAAA